VSTGARAQSSVDQQRDPCGCAGLLGLVSVYEREREREREHKPQAHK
jgi:hypothetical protein